MCVCVCVCVYPYSLVSLRECVCVPEMFLEAVVWSCLYGDTNTFGFTSFRVSTEMKEHQ